jgi:hypothetical protein
MLGARDLHALENASHMLPNGRGSLSGENLVDQAGHDQKPSVVKLRLPITVLLPSLRIKNKGPLPNSYP